MTDVLLKNHKKKVKTNTTYQIKFYLINDYHTSIKDETYWHKNCCSIVVNICIYQCNMRAKPVLSYDEF